MSKELLMSVREKTSLRPVASKISWLAGIQFPAETEADFQNEMDSRRRTQLIGLVAILLYGLFGITDRIMLPDVYVQAWAIRFLLVIPLLALYTFGITKVERSVAREVLMSAMVIMVAASVVFITSLSDHPNADHYHFGIILVVLFGNIVLKLRPRAAIVSSLVITSIYAILLTHMNSLAAEVRSNDLLIFITSVVISLIASFQMDQDQRRAYLARIREQQRNDELIDTVEQLGKLSAEDPLTEIANRREFDRRLKMEWGRARRETQPLALILVDVDFFKSYNDNYGHPAGDVCLQRVASTLCSVPQRSTDLVARLGGEEFVVLLPGTSVNDAAQLAEQMRRAILELNAEHIGSTAAPVVSASFGVTAILPGPQDEQAQLLANADVALYNAKKNGRNRVVIHAAP